MPETQRLAPLPLKMKITITYGFSQDDEPWQKRIEHAFNRLINFAPELQEDLSQPDQRKKTRTPELIAFNRIIGGEFDIEDVKTLNSYVATLFDRVQERYTAAGPELTEMKHGCVQAGVNACTIMSDFTAWFMEENARLHKIMGDFSTVFSACLADEAPTEPGKVLRNLFAPGDWIKFPAMPVDETK